MHGIGLPELVWTLGVAAFSIAPLVLLLLMVKWLYESKKSLAEISATLKDIKAEVSVGKSSMENEHE